MSAPDPRVDMLIGSTQTDITSDVYFDGGVSHSRGRSGEGARVDPATVGMTLKSPDGLYSPRNPVSPYYGLIGRNTPLLATVAGGEVHLVGDGAMSSNKGASTPDTAVLDITGDLDVRLEAALDNWGAFGSVELMGKGLNAGSQRSWILMLSSGLLRLEWSADGANMIQKNSTLPLTVPGTRRLVVRATLDVNNGAAGNTLTFYTGASLSGPWTQLGAPVITPGVTSIFSGTAPLLVGQGMSDVGIPSASGSIYGAEVRSGIGGTVVANPSFTVQAPGATGFTDAAGRAWSVLSGSSITDRAGRFVVEVPEWSPRWTVGAADVNTPIQGAGILRRLGQGQKALASTLRRRIPAFSPLAYWPCEEEDGATQAYSPIEGVDPLTVVGFDFGQDSSLGGSAALPSVDAAGWMTGAVPAPTSTSTEWSVHMLYSVDSVPTTDGTFLSWNATGTVRRWRIVQGATVATVQGYDSAGDLFLDQAISTGSGIYDGWHRLRLFARQNGSSVDWKVTWFDIGGTSASFTGAFTGTVGRVTRVNTQFSAAVSGLNIGHLAVFDVAEPAAYTLADHGFSGETAGSRAVRLAGEEGLPFRLIGDATIRMGPQRPNTLLALLAECEASDGGVLYEDRTRLGLVYRGRASLYNQAPALTLSYSQIVQPFEPVDDDSRIRNDVTRTRSGGTSARVVRETGPLSVQAPPLGVGIYDESVTLSLDTDDQPQQIAAWAMHLGTWDEARYKQVRILLHQHPELVSAAVALDVGDVVRITDLPGFLPPGPVDLMVEGYKEVLTGLTWELVLNCSPAGPWSVGVVGDPVLGRADTDGSQLAAGVTSTATSWSVAVTAGPRWIDSAAYPAQFPFSVICGGEEVTVTAITGTVSPQTFTVTRSTNGIVKPQTAGAPLSLTHPMRAAL